MPLQWAISMRSSVSIPNFVEISPGMRHHYVGRWRLVQHISSQDKLPGKRQRLRKRGSIGGAESTARLWVFDNHCHGGWRWVAAVSSMAVMTIGT